MSVYEEAFNASDTGLPKKLTPKYQISRGEDDALQWQPSARSRELANALSYHYPLENTIEEKMQRAILDFLESELRDGISSQKESKETLKCKEKPDPPKITKTNGKTTPGIQHPGESPPQSLQIVQGSEMFGAWDVKTGQSVKPKGRKRGLSPTTRQRVAENRGNTCAYHRKAKTQCHPSQCRQNKLYSGTVGNSILMRTDQVVRNDKGKVDHGKVGMSNEVSTTRTYDDGHIEKRFKGLPSPSLSPSESITLIADKQTLYNDLDHKCHESGPNPGKDDIRICLSPQANQDHVASDKLLLGRSESLSQKSSDFVQDLQGVSEGDVAYLPVNTNEISQGSSQSAMDHSPSEWRTDSHEELPSIGEMGGTDYFDWTEDLMESDLPSLERDWPREDFDAPPKWLAFGLESDKYSASDLPFVPNTLNRFGTVDDSGYSFWPSSIAKTNLFTNSTASIISQQEPTILSESNMDSLPPRRTRTSMGRSDGVFPVIVVPPSPRHEYNISSQVPTNPYRAKEYMQARRSSSMNGGIRFTPEKKYCAYSPHGEENDGPLSLRPPDELQDTSQQVQVPETATNRDSRQRVNAKKLKDLRYYRSKRVEEAGPEYINGALSLSCTRESIQISVDSLATLLQNSHLNLIGNFEQLYPGKDKSSLTDIVLLDDADRIASVEPTPETILNLVRLSSDKIRLLRSSCHIGADSSFEEILPDLSSLSSLSNDLRSSIAANDSLKNQAETSSTRNLYLEYISSLLEDVSATSNPADGRLITLIHRSEAAVTIAKRGIITPHDSIQQSSIANTYSIRWLDSSWRNLESIIADGNIYTNPNPYSYRISDALCIGPSIHGPPIFAVAHSHQFPPLDTGSVPQAIERRCSSGTEEAARRINSSSPSQCTQQEGDDALELVNMVTKESAENTPVSPVEPDVRDAVASVMIDKAVTRARQRRRPAAVIMIKKPVDAMKALWTKLARVKL